MDARQIIRRRVQIGLWILGCACAAPTVASTIPTSTDYVLFPTVDVGQKLVIQFSFDPSADLVGSLGANAIILDVGGIGTASNTITSLYAASTLLGSASTLLGSASSHSGGGAGMFFADNLGYSAGYFWSKAVDSAALTSLLEGAANGILEVTPFGGSMAWSGWGPHAGILSGMFAAQDIFPIANIASVRVLDVSQPTVTPLPIPGTLPLAVVGLVMMGLIGRLRRAPAV